MTTLINFGDSWATGAYTEPQTRYSEYIAQRLQIDYLCCAVPSSSVPGLLWQLQKFLAQKRRKRETYVALFFLTAKDRQVLQQNNQLIESSVHAHECLDFYARYYGDQLGDFTWNTSLMAVRYLCQRHRIIDLYLPGWEINQASRDLDLDRFFDQNRTTMMSLFTGDARMNLTDSIETYPQWFVTGHPNREAHSRLADVLTPWVQQHLP